MQYHYDANGNRTKVVRGAQTEWYGVDNADKLLWTNTTATGAPNPGAPTAGQGSGYSLFGYDALGQTTTRDRRGKDGQRHTFNFNWDADGRLREVWENDAPALTAQYTADGERVNKTDGAGAHVNSFRLHDSAGAGITYTPGFAERKNGQDRYTSQDHLGSTRYLTDSTGNTTPAALRYDAYGLRSASAGTDPAHPTDHQYAGAWGYQREETAGLGLDYLHHRYYDAEAGRFITRDPIRWAGGLNLYGYVGNDPIQGVDPLGLRKPLPFSTFDSVTSNPVEAAAAYADIYGGAVAAARTIEIGPAVTIGIAGLVAEKYIRPRTQVDGDAFHHERYGSGRQWLAEEIAQQKAKAKQNGCNDASGQIHHVLSNPIMTALGKHQILAGLFEREDPRFKVRAANAIAHKGYQSWHREYDKMVVDWLTSHPQDGVTSFLTYLGELHQHAGMQQRFPGYKVPDPLDY